eukprot:scaffold281025_cov31-Tisochrysis_lutea.AAC.1
MYQRIELVADLREEPVPTTSPTYATGKPFLLRSSICILASVIPSRGNLSMASAWSGMSGRDQASGAGDKSSVAFGEPLSIGPGLDHLLGEAVAGLRLLFDVMEGVEDENGVGERLGRRGRKRVVIQRIDQRLDIVTALHGTEQLNRMLAADERRGGLALADGGEVSCLDVGCLINPRRHALAEQLEQRLRLILGRVAQQLTERRSARRIESERDDAKRSPLGNMRIVVGEKGRLVPPAHARHAARHATRQSSRASRQHAFPPPCAA